MVLRALLVVACMWVRRLVQVVSGFRDTVGLGLTGLCCVWSEWLPLCRIVCVVVWFVVLCVGMVLVGFDVVCQDGSVLCGA